MKKIILILSLLLCCASLSACGKQGADTLQDEPAEYTDVKLDSESILNGEGSAGHMIGMQFHQQEAVQILASRNEGMVDIYLYGADGNELLLEGMHEDYYFGHWFLDAEGNFYRWTINDDIIKLDPSGKEVFRVPLKDIGATTLKDICQLPDGRVFITYLENGGGSAYTLSELDTATGEVSKSKTARLDGLGRVAAGTVGLLYMDTRGVYEIDMGNGSKSSILTFIGTSFLLEDMDGIEDFRMLEDGSVEVLRYDRDNRTGVSEVVKASAEAVEKTVLTLRCYNFSKLSAYGTPAWLKRQIQRFNQQSENYLVVLDENSEGVEREDFARQTSIEIMAGKGPDLIYGDVLGDYAYGAIQKGAIVDLLPYMEASGIKEEDYFAAAFGCWKENGGIYGVCLEVLLESYRMDEDVLGGREEPDAEALVDALLAWQGDVVFARYTSFDAQELLRYFLQGSESLCGMVDWEAGTCDFSGKLFARMLEAAGRYGNKEGKKYPAVAEQRQTNLVGFDTAADREAEKMVVAGMLFDDGCHAAVTSALPGFGNGMLAVNANSANVDGAWELISFLLGEEAQTAFESDDPNYISYAIPVNKKAFDVCTQKRVKKSINMKMIFPSSHRTAVRSNGEVEVEYKRGYEDLTEEKVAEYREFVEDARPLPIRTMPLLDIICEEAEYYFDGTKGIAEVVSIIQNRVQLYMDENR